jgi:hypothetical protein
MKVAGRFKTNPNRQAQIVEKLCNGTNFLSGILHTESLAALRSGCFDEHLVAILGDIDGYPDNGYRRIVRVGHSRSVFLSEC